MDVSLETAYIESCRALGEANVRERFYGAEIKRLTELLEVATEDSDASSD